MELYLFRPQEYQRLYGCINITVDEIPLQNRLHITEGVIFITLAIIYYILYIPSIYSICRHIQYPCYKILLYISVIDCGILWLVGFAHGFFAITGAVFCSHPTFTYFVGCYLWGVWCAETSGQTILVINRCVSMLSSELEQQMFGGRRLLLWLGVSIGSGIYSYFYVKPILYSGTYSSWFMNPYVGYREDPEEIYVTSFFVLWDGSFAIVVPVLYIVFFSIYFAKSHGIASKKISKQQKKMLLQVFVMSFFNFIAAFTFTYMMFIVPTQVVITFAQFCWFQIHGFPPVIFLVFNPTIRKDAKKMLSGLISKFKLHKVHAVSKTASSAGGRTSNSVL